MHLPLPRRTFCGSMLAALLTLTGCATPTPMTTVAYVSSADSREIRVLALDRAQGGLRLLQTVPVGGTVMPLALSPDRRTLYAALRSEPYTVAAFRIDGTSGLLQPLATAPLPDSMANIAVSPDGRWLYAASYGGHRISVSPLAADGTPSAATQVLATGKNAHAAIPDASGRHLFVTNLGSDQVLSFDITPDGTLKPGPTPVMKAHAGSGPRHLVLADGGRRAYLLNELDATLDLLDVDTATGALTPRARQSTLPPGFSGKPWAADLHLRPDGRFLYTSERTSNTIAIWRVDAATGQLTLVAHQPTERQPRGFQIDRTGGWLLAVGQLSHAGTLYRVDRETGLLTPSAQLPLGQGPNWVEFVDLR